jgi:putative Holliday junction resolvase
MRRFASPDEMRRFASPGRVLGVDLGTRRVGLAITDPTRTISSPLKTIPAGSESALARALLGLCAEKDVRLVVVGLPVSADGSEGPGCERARRIAARLEQGGMPVVLHDESWSSRDAEEVIRETGKTRRSTRDGIDAIAASLILRDYLAGVSRP